MRIPEEEKRQTYTAGIVLCWIAIVGWGFCMVLVYYDYTYLPARSMKLCYECKSEPATRQVATRYTSGGDTETERFRLSSEVVVYLCNRCAAPSVIRDVPEGTHLYELSHSRSSRSFGIAMIAGVFLLFFIFGLSLLLEVTGITDGFYRKHPKVHRFTQRIFVLLNKFAVLMEKLDEQSRRN